MTNNYLAEIENSGAVALWLKKLGVGQFHSLFELNGWYGQTLIDLLPDALEDALGDRASSYLIYAELKPFRDLVRQTSGIAQTRSELDQAANNCRQLGQEWNNHAYLQTIYHHWPGPIAHELATLGQLLNAGKPIGALMQMRDCAEILIKLPAISLACDILANEHSPELEQTVRQAFFNSQLSMGTWLDLVCNLSKAVKKDEKLSQRLQLPELATIFIAPSNKESVFCDAINDQVVLRNKELGHGAMRADENEVVAILRHYLLGNLNQRQFGYLALPKITPLANALEWLTQQAVWQSLRMAFVDDHDKAIELVVYEKMCQHHDSNFIDAEAEISSRALILFKDSDPEQKVRLSPYLAGRSCALCGRQDLFFLNGWEPKKNRFDLLDYMRGHRMRRPWHQVTDLHLEAVKTPRLENEAKEPQTYNLSRASTIALLDETAVDRRYLSPDYLRKSLTSFLQNHDKGIFWLQAPGHIGKSTFVAGLADSQINNASPLPHQVKVASVFIRREYRFGPGQLAPLLEHEVKQALDIAEQTERRLPQIDLQAEDKPAELVKFLQEYLSMAPHFRGQLLTCLDGLDELRTPENGISMLDFIPAPEELPERVYLLLTSRPPADHACPDWVIQRLMPLTTDVDWHIHTVDIHDQGYRALLKAYFQRETRAQQAIEEVGLLKHGETPEQAKQQVKTRFERLFELLLVKADGLFLYLAFLIDRIKERGLAIDEIDSQSSTETLYSLFLDSLPEKFSPKQADLAKRVILTLAALEQAHAWYLDGQDPPFAVEPEWRGIPLDSLAELLQLQPDDAELIYVLYRLKSVLGSWRGGSVAVSHYRLALKGLSEALTANPLFRPQLTVVHERLARETLMELAASDFESTDDSSAENTIDPNRLRYAYAHAVLSCNDSLPEQLAEIQEFRGQILNLGASANQLVQFGKAVNWFSLAIRLCTHHWQSGKPLTFSWIEDLADVYSKRGVVRRARNDLSGAEADYGQAIGLRDWLRQQLGEDWPAAWANGLAATYVNRGNARSDRHDLSGADADFGQAIGLRDWLRQQLGEDWPPAWANDLANAYMNRGIARSERTDLSGADADYSQAIAFSDGVRQQLGESWPPAWANDLANTYMNRGVGRRARNDLNGAEADYGQAIILRDWLRHQLGEDWPAAWANGLANTYMNRGNARSERNELSGADADYAQAIALMDELRQQLGEDWPPAWANDLAQAYVGRGVVHRKRSDLRSAEADYAQAIALMDELRQQLDEDWPPAWAIRLAGAYVNRGDARSACNDLSGADADYAQGIGLMDGLRQQLGEDWPPAWANGLASAYVNRGDARSACNDLSGADADYVQAIDLMDGLRQQLGEDWPPAWAIRLAGAYVNRGDARSACNDLSGADADYAQGIGLMDGVRQQLGEDWPPAWANALAIACLNRGVVRMKGRDLRGAEVYFALAIGLMDELQLQLGEDFPPAWANDLVSAYTNQCRLKISQYRISEAQVDGIKAYVLSKKVYICAILAHTFLLQENTKMARRYYLEALEQISGEQTFPEDLLSDFEWFINNDWQVDSVRAMRDELLKIFNEKQKT